MHDLHEIGMIIEDRRCYMDKIYKKISDLIGFRNCLVIVLLFTGFIQFSLMFNDVQGDTYNLQVSQLASETIRATKTVEDTVKTEQEKERAASEVQPVYQFSEEVANNRAALVTSLFDYVIDVKKQTTIANDMEKQIKALRKKIDAFDQEQFAITLTDQQLTLLLKQSEQDLLFAKEQLASQVKQYLQRAIRKEQVTASKNEFESTIRQQLEYNGAILPVVVIIGRASIVETEILNEALTDQRIAQAKDAVEPTRILQGQVIVQEGQVIDREVYRQLELLGMLQNHASVKPMFGLLLLTVVQMIFFFSVFDKWPTTERKKGNALLATVIIYMLMIVMMKLMSMIEGNFDVTIAFMFPTALATMMIRLLANDRIAAVVTVMMAASAGVIFLQSYASVLQMDMTLYIILGGFASLFFMQRIDRRSSILQVSAIVSVVNVLFIVFYLLMTQSDYSLVEWLFYIGVGTLSGVLSGALTIGLLPFFESAFGVLSTLRLIELSNPNHPLLKKLLIETPGTYHHSVMVANLAEAACEAIGANGLLARVGCYYHDIGKTKRPQFFIENQVANMNPHDVLEPEQSAKIILAHTTDGAALLEQYKMPEEIIDIAKQHHGTSMLKYFTFKAKEQGKEIDEANFRYPGPKPMTKEAAVISVADSVEAAVRSMKQPTAEKISKLVEMIVADRLADHQFDECDLSIKELKTIQRVMCETLNGIFHSRIEYPKED